MKQIKLFTLLLTSIIGLTKSNAQTQLTTNANINIVTANAGLVSPGGSIDLSVSVANTGANPIQRNRVRPNISIPIAIATAMPNVDQTGLPPGWVITANTGGTITICNGTDVIPAGETRVAIIKIQGTTLGGPSLIGAALQFGPGTAVCTGLGSLTGDNSADNSSNTTITVTNTAPLTLLDFNASVINCKPSLLWITDNELNTLKFEIQRASINTPSNWAKIGEVNAQGFSSIRTKYALVDQSLSTSDEKVLYRLKMIDLNSDFKYSPVISVYTNCNKTQASVYPNPVSNGFLNISLNGFSTNTTAVLKSNTGQIVLTKNIANGTSTLNVNTIPNGVYILSISDNKNNTEQRKVIIQH